MPTREYSYTDTLFTHNNYGVKRGEFGEKVLSIEMNKHSVGSRFQKWLQKKGNKHIHPEDLALGAIGPQSFKSSLMECEYMLKISFGHRGCTLFSRIPYCTVPVKLITPTIPDHLS